MTLRTLHVWLALLLALAISPLPALAQGHGQGHKHGPKGKEERAEHEEDQRGPVFHKRDKEIIRNYFRRNQFAGLPPGLAKRGGKLPPGLERQLRRNGQLPPGLQKRLQPLPIVLERRLPRLPTGYRRGIIGDNVVLLDPRARIADILYKVLSAR